jgi:DNA-binding YbaB/EbfC family protein
MDVKELMAAATQLKERLKSAQTQAKAVKVEVETGGGLVKLAMNGNNQVESLRIDPSCLGPGVRAEDVRLLEDLVLAAFNQAAQKVEKCHKERMSGLATEFGVTLNDADIPSKMPQ